jgi:hypothetical protein
MCRKSQVETFIGHEKDRLKGARIFIPMIERQGRKVI